MARGIERREVFVEGPDFSNFVGRLEAVVSSTGVRVFAWALFPNHFRFNPIRAGCVGNVEELRSFAYAGRSALLGAVDRVWQATEEELGRFGGAVNEARQRYERFVGEGADEGCPSELVGRGGYWG